MGTILDEDSLMYFNVDSIFLIYILGNVDLRISVDPRISIDSVMTPSLSHIPTLQLLDKSIEKVFMILRGQIS